MWFYVILVLGCVFLILYAYLTYHFNYWRNRYVKGPKPIPFIGTFPKMVLKNYNLIYDHMDIYRKYKSTERFVGVFTIREPELMILCPNLVQDVFIKYFKNFHDNAAGHWIDHKEEKIISRSAFFLTGDKWKEGRSHIVPHLTMNKLKSWYEITQEACKKLSVYIKTVNDLNSAEECCSSINMRNLAMRFTVQITSNTIFGIEAYSFNAEITSTKSFIMEANDKFVDEFANRFQEMSYLTKIPFLKHFFKRKFLSESTKHFFKNLLKDAMKLRLEMKVRRNDFLDGLIELEEKKNLDLEDLVGLALTFTLDGYDTTATVISQCLLLLARNKNAQNKLREEILKNLDNNGSLNFEKLNEMQYLDQCINGILNEQSIQLTSIIVACSFYDEIYTETMRIFPPIAFSLKYCTNTTTLENYNGDKITINPGQTVHLPLYAIYHDPMYYPEPEKFIPERFNEEFGGVKKFRDEGKFFPFGDGPRICPGMKFGLLQSKAAIAEIIQTFMIDIDKRTRNDNKVGSISLAALLKGKIWLKLKELE